MGDTPKPPLKGLKQPERSLEDAQCQARTTTSLGIAKMGDTPKPPLKGLKQPDRSPGGVNRC